MERAIIYL